MNEPKKPEDAPGHYGAGYGEQVPQGAAPRPAPATDAAADGPAVVDAELPESLLAPETVIITETLVVVETPVAVESLVEIEAPAEPPAETGTPNAGDTGAPVVFTPTTSRFRRPTGRRPRKRRRARKRA